MILEMLILGTGAAVWNKISPLPKNSSKRRKQRAAGKRNGKPLHPIRPKQLVRDIRRALKDEERQELQMDIDPEQRKELEKQKQKTRQEMRLSVGAFGLAVLSGWVPALTGAGILAVLYLSRETFTLIRKDFKRGHYFSVYLIWICVDLAMIGTGHLALAAFGGVMGNFFAGIVNRVEEESQHQLISVFSGHPEQVWLLRDGVEIQVDFHSLEKGDILVVNAGEVIPADGRIRHGEGQADQHLLTGESRPAEKSVGDTVFASTLLLSGRLEVEVTGAGSATMASQIGGILNQTQNYKDTMISRGRKISDRLLPLNLGVAAATMYLLGANAALAVMWSNLGGIMAPAGSLTVLSYLQLLSRRSVLIKDGRVLESLRDVDTVVFDKTGTLTLDQPTVGAVHALNGFDEKAVLRYAAAAEYRQPHPVARAVVAKAEVEQIILPNPENADYEVGYGIRVRTEGRMIQVGSARFLEREGIQLPVTAFPLRERAEAEGHSLIYVGIDGQAAGVLELEPTVRPEAAEVIEFLKERNIRCCILSGDHEAPTKAMAAQLGIEEYFAEVLPENKADYVKQLKEEGRFVCFIGDGINDAVALKTAQVSVSLKGASTAATDTAQVILMDGTLNNLPSLFEAADDFEETMQRNLVISIAPGISIISGVWLFHFGIAAAMGIFYLSCFMSIGNVLWPLVREQEDKSDLKTDNTLQLVDTEETD
ncbi:MAG: heavy metal translocating P-type ATPase [Candidatus Electrothrix aestuarii]|uniref:Heavy metal translocating P-type ATPase n=1 Tax=Candidatus Electrothrix aestuarii TaxID=3062594 RepID=A0AAU8LTT5_9BACT|nr:heavy metal translocating P-type ATPase [Candidatus Electrothrix aestuarii]